MYGCKKERAGCYRHPSGWVLLRTEGWGDSGKRHLWENVDDVTERGAVVDGTVYAQTLREAVADLERLLGTGDLTPRVAREAKRPTCPDGGYCHHSCSRGCFRVRYCGPFSDTYPGDVWPTHIVEANASLEHGDPITAAIVAPAPSDVQEDE